jgi:hypothetical protein
MVTKYVYISGWVVVLAAYLKIQTPILLLDVKILAQQFSIIILQYINDIWVPIWDSGVANCLLKYMEECAKGF